VLLSPPIYDDADVHSYTNSSKLSGLHFSSGLIHKENILPSSYIIVLQPDLAVLLYSLSKYSLFFCM